MKLSIITPIFNEEKSLPELFSSLVSTLDGLGYDYEIIAVNDGSRDGSKKVLAELAQKNPQLKVINFRINAGQTAALQAGIEHAVGDIIIPIDADLENDPADIPLLLAKMDEGFEVVSGWRKNRWKGNWLFRKLPSMIANWFISKISGVPLHDYGCTLKAYKREIVQELNLYGEMHRFIPAYAAHYGALVAEVPVSYKPRKYGTSNYGFSRTIRVVLDLLILRFMQKYMDRPIHFFGTIGFFFGFIGGLAGVSAIGLRIFYDLHLVETPLPVFSALCIIVGVQLLTMGVLAEMIMRTYYETQKKRSYIITERINIVTDHINLLS